MTLAVRHRPPRCPCKPDDSAVHFSARKVGHGAGKSSCWSRLQRYINPASALDIGVHGGSDSSRLVAISPGPQPMSARGNFRKSIFSFPSTGVRQIYVLYGNMHNFIGYELAAGTSPCFTATMPASTVPSGAMYTRTVPE